jgi:cyclohexyl-isocyanide hydratase
VDQATAEGIQLGIEYNPAPPFSAGSPETAPAAVRATLEEKMAPSRARRIEVAKRAAAKLK